MPFDVLQSVAVALNVVLVAVIALSCFRLMRRWRHRRFLSLDFFGMGSSYLLLMTFGVMWFITLNQTFFFLLAVMSIFFTASYSYATLRISHPHERRPADWALLMYASAAVIWLVTKDILFVTLQILLLSSLVTFVSSLTLLQLCKRPMRKYAVAGLLVGIISASYIPTLAFPVVSLINATGFLLFLPINTLLAYLLFGFLRTSQQSPGNFICDYDHKREGK